MHQQRLHVVLDESLVSSIDLRVGNRGRSRFVAEAVRTRLAQLRQSEALEQAVGAWSKEEHPELAGGAAAHISSRREADEALRGRS